MSLHPTPSVLAFDVPSRLRRVPFFKPTASPRCHDGAALLAMCSADAIDPRCCGVHKGIAGWGRFFARWEEDTVAGMRERDEVVGAEAPLALQEAERLGQTAGIPESVPACTLALGRIFRRVHDTFLLTDATSSSSKPCPSRAPRAVSLKLTLLRSEICGRDRLHKLLEAHDPDRTPSPLATSTASRIPVALKTGTALLEADHADRSHLAPACAPPRAALGARPACRAAAARTARGADFAARPRSRALRREARDTVDGLHVRSRLALPPRSARPPIRISSPVVPREADAVVAMALGESLMVVVDSRVLPSAPCLLAVPCRSCEANAVVDMKDPVVDGVRACTSRAKTPAAQALLLEVALEGLLDQIEAVVGGCACWRPRRQRVGDVALLCGTALALLAEVALGGLACVYVASECTSGSASGASHAHGGPEPVQGDWAGGRRSGAGMHVFICNNN
ncbi:hypothetical protein DFH09DRAFT_1320778 [Mycena vulgaris]|nr:hypothetical protein DFH09DRAFT_1320778 [Mycena vulgaris]